MARLLPCVVILAACAAPRAAPAPPVESETPVSAEPSTPSGAPTPTARGAEPSVVPAVPPVALAELVPLPELPPLAAPHGASPALARGLAAVVEGRYREAEDCFAVVARDEDAAARALAWTGLARSVYEAARATPATSADCVDVVGTETYASERMWALRSADELVGCIGLPEGGALREAIRAARAALDAGCPPYDPSRVVVWDRSLDCAAPEPRVGNFLSRAEGIAPSSGLGVVRRAGDLCAATRPPDGFGSVLGSGGLGSGAGS